MSQASEIHAQSSFHAKTKDCDSNLSPLFTAYKNTLTVGRKSN